MEADQLQQGLREGRELFEGREATDREVEVERRLYVRRTGPVAGAAARPGRDRFARGERRPG